MKPRITVNLAASGEFEIWLNELGRDLLVKQLLHLSETSDHFHLGPPGIGEVEVSSRPYRSDDKILEFGKVMYRTDAWDEKFHPSVLRDTP